MSLDSTTKLQLGAAALVLVLLAGAGGYWVANRSHPTSSPQAQA